MARNENFWHFLENRFRRWLIYGIFGSKLFFNKLISNLSYHFMLNQLTSIVTYAPKSKKIYTYLKNDTKLLDINIPYHENNQNLYA